MGYDEKNFKAKANIKARRLWLVAILLTAIMVPTQQMALILSVIISFCILCCCLSCMYILLKKKEG